MLSKSRQSKRLATAEEGQARRKLSLFIRTIDAFKANPSGPLFAASSGAVPVPNVASAIQQQRGSQLAVPGGGCHPQCFWNCGNAACDEVCQPVCAPPQCETACGPINTASCRQRCDAPTCAIVCPEQACAHGGCPACKTVCSPPKCHTDCAENCESKCSEPQCTWKCKPGKCEKPRCSLTCGGAKACGLDANLNARPPPFDSGMTVVAKGLAATDPKSLPGFAAKPAAPPSSSTDSKAPAPASSGARIR